MKKLRFIYRMEIRFSSPVNSHYFALRCIPGDSSRQRIILTEQNIYPADYLSRTKDGFGNVRLNGCCQGPHETFGYTIVGTAQTKGMEVVKEPLHPMYRYPSFYTRPDPEIAAFACKAERLCREQGKEENLEKAVCVMGMLYEGFSYVSGSTDISTTAGEALKQGKGVCQDYAHIMTAVLRYMGIPARYVIDRGCFRGNAGQEQKIYVKVEEIKNDGNSGGNETAGG